MKLNNRALHSPVQVERWWWCVCTCSVQGSGVATLTVHGASVEEHAVDQVTHWSAARATLQRRGGGGGKQDVRSCGYEYICVSTLSD